MSKNIPWESEDLSLDVILNPILDKFKSYTTNDQVFWQHGIRSFYKKSALDYYDNHFRTEQCTHKGELSHSTKNYIFIFQEESIAIQYGIGTYTHTLLKCFDTSLWNVNVIPFT